jgi:hypothetical protein
MRRYDFDMNRRPSLRRYWFHASHQLGIGVTAPDAGTAWFMAEGALERLPPGTTLSRRYIEDVDPNSLGLPENIKNTMAPGVWFPPGTVRRAQLRAAQTPEEAASNFVMIDDDGCARALTEREAKYLATSFDAGDGGRPYLKLHYDTRTPDGRLLGFLRRSELPAHVPVRPAESRDD